MKPLTAEQRKALKAAQAKSRRKRQRMAKANAVVTRLIEQSCGVPKAGAQ